MNKRVLVTGASGFIGRHALGPLIHRGFEVHAVYGNASVESDSRIVWHKADLLDEKSIATLVRTVQATHLLHFAWIATPGVYWTSPENIRWKESTLTLLRAFRENGGTRATISGTCAEYDWSVPQESLSEMTSPLKPATLYGQSKHETHLLAEKFATAHDLSLVWGRIFFLYGPHEEKTRLVPYVINSLLRGEIAKCTSGAQIRDFLHVQDVADAFVSLLDSYVTGAINIASGQAIAVRDIIFAIAGMLGKRDLVRLGAKMASPNDPPRLVADVSRLQGEVLWHPNRNLTDGLRSTIEWWRKLT